MTTKTISQVDYSIQNLSDEYVKSTVDLFTKAFCDSEPITKHVGIKYDDYETFATEVVQKAVKDGLSKIAVDKQHNVIACCLAEDIADSFIPKLAHYPKLRPIVALLEELSRPFLKDKTFIKGKIAHVWIAAVDPEYRGLGLSTAIDTACSDALARKGYDFAYVEFTNELSERIVNQYTMYQLINRIKYEDFKLGDTKPFKDVRGGAASYIIVIRPGIKLDALENDYKIEEKY